MVAQWLDMQRPKIWWCHCPNGGYRNKREAARFQRMGVKPGVPDIMIYSRPPNHPSAGGVAIELKRPKGGSTTRDQERWLQGLEERGWKVAVCHGFDEAVAFLNEMGWE